MADQDSIEAKEQTVDKLFRSPGVVFRCPMFQRRYVWDKTNLDKLTEDISAVMDTEDNHRFLGALVLQNHAGASLFTDDVDEYWIIDGQQRLTTIYLFLMSIGIALQARDAEESKSIFRRLLNQEPEVRNEPKLVPTSRDLWQFADVFGSVTAAEVKTAPRYGERDGAMATMRGLIDAYLINGLSTRDEDAGRIWLKDMDRVIRHKLKFVAIELSRYQDPHQVFDRLNNAGQRLEVTDLVRNEIFSRYKDDHEAAEKTFEDRWKPLEERLGSSVSKFFFPFALVHDVNTTKNKSFSSLQNRWEGWKPQQIIDDLAKYEVPFLAMEGRAKVRTNTSLSDLLDQCTRMPLPTVVYPFLMRVIREGEEGNLGPDDVYWNVRLVESFLVRRSFQGLEATGLHAVFKRLWAVTEGDPNLLVDGISRSSTIKFASDEDFARFISANPMAGRKLAPYILTQWELDRKTGDALIPPKVTVDHIAPRSASNSWRESFAGFDYDRLIHTVSNLAPLSGKMNGFKGNVSWSEVRDALAVDNAFRITRELARQRETWGINDVRERADEFIEFAVRRWPSSTEPRDSKHLASLKALGRRHFDEMFTVV